MENLSKALEVNGYPKQFIEKYQVEVPRLAPCATVPKKLVFLELPFKGDQLAGVTQQRLNAAIGRTFNAARLCIIPRTRTLPAKPQSSILTDLDTPHSIYNFECSCGERYIGRTNRHLRTRIGEHIPRWLETTLSQPWSSIDPDGHKPTSSIARHIIDTSHRVNLSTAFSVIYRSNRGRSLQFAEALAIRRHNPTLCVQKQFVLTLQLP